MADGTAAMDITESVRLEHTANVALLRIDNPPVNALSHHVRRGIVDGIAAAEASDADAIVLICGGRTFIAGADITEFDKALKPPALSEAQAAIEDCTKPVVAAIHGTALGGGLEVALCAHYRVSVADGQFGLPEVKLGLLPGAGGTQRLPRVTGPAKAAEMVTTGVPIPADEALTCGLVDLIVDDLETGAIEFARRCVEEQLPLLRIRDRADRLADTPADLFDAMRAKMARKTRGFLAPEYNLRCIEAAVTLPFEEGLSVERQLFSELMADTQSAAQRYYFFAERLANKIPDIDPNAELLPIETAGVLGAGTMGGGIAMNFANAGIPVVLVEREPEALERGLGVIRGNYERTAKRGGITTADVDSRMALITGSLDKADFAEADIVVEAVFENMDLKKSVFAELDEICKPGAILASNTSALNIDEIASVTGSPESVIGLHFFSPANVMKLLEVVRGDATSDSVIATSMALAKRVGKIPVLCRVCHGFIGNRMLAMRRIEAERMILEGATPAQIDKVVFDFGFPMGPFAMSDLAGLDIGWSADTSTGSTVRELLCESGRRGQKNGRGYYTYDPETRASTPDQEVEQMIRDFAAARGVQQREVTDQEILERLLYPMINEGAKILEEGIALRGSDIDVVWINGYGWPVYTGGPMFWADTVGLSKVVETISRNHAELGGDHWALSPLLARLAAEGADIRSYTS